ncbi:MAG: S8 family serine peptidase [Candidatus Moranbacteria bacterium]|jgi:hypothetical protein|nr:S8 family serine peptidase [Candidatus Moranbacteria bacterium]
MKKIFLFAFLFLTFNLVPPAQAKDQDFPTLPAFGEKEKSSDKKNYIEGEVIVKYKDSKRQKSFENKIKENKRYSDLEIKNKINNKRNISLLKDRSKKTEELINELKNNPDIEIIEPNFKRSKFFTPSDAYFSYQWSLRNTGQSIEEVFGTLDADIDADEMWDIESLASTETIVAVIDDGVDYNHPDLINNMWDGSSCVDESENPIIGGCPNHGWDYQNNDNDPYFNEHGTFVSSIIASQSDNSSGIAGISRYNKIKVMAIKFDFEDTFSELRAIDFAINNGAKVINASYGGDGYSQIEKNLIESFNGIFVAASGNLSNNNDAYPQYPCSYNSANIICVASSDQNDNLSDFSNYGPTTVDIMAPGENMIGVYLGTYYIGAGTSIATPLVAGTTALLYAHDPGASINKIRETLLKSSDHFSDNTTIACGRRLNTKKSLNSLIFNEIPFESCAPSTKPIYRFWSDQNQGHFYTSSEEEKNMVINNYDDYIWRYEGVAFNSLISGKPVYRFWSDKNQHHFYTANEEEKNMVINNYDDYIWRYEGIAYYLPEISAKPIYRFWSDQNQSHFYTANEEERNTVINNYDDYIWRYEGVAFYAY